MSKIAGRSPNSTIIRVREAPMRPLPPVIKIDMLDLLAFFLTFIKMCRNIPRLRWGMNGFPLPLEGEG
jgi:hypothetical protein